MHLFPPVYNPWYMFYLFSNKYWYVSFFQYFILLHVHHGLKLQCTGKKIINTNAWHHNGIPDINIVHKHYERYGDMYTSTYKQAPHMPYLIHKNKFSSISFNAIIIYKITLQLINGKKITLIFYSFIKIHFVTFQTCNFKMDILIHWREIKMMTLTNYKFSTMLWNKK